MLMVNDVAAVFIAPRRVALGRVVFIAEKYLMIHK